MKVAKYHKNQVSSGQIRKYERPSLESVRLHSSSVRPSHIGERDELAQSEQPQRRAIRAIGMTIVSESGRVGAEQIRYISASDLGAKLALNMPARHSCAVVGEWKSCRRRPQMPEIKMTQDRPEHAVLAIYFPTERSAHACASSSERHLGPTTVLSKIR